jgi:hypothetical protein
MIVVPGIGTPMRIAMIMRIAMMTAINLIATAKDRDHGWLSLKDLTNIAQAKTRPAANHG